MVHSQKAWCSHEGTNRTWDEGSLCRVIPCRACSTLRGTSVRCAEVVPVNVWRASSWYKSPLCPVVPCRAFPTPRSMKARYAACDSGQRDPAERSCSYQFQCGRLCASTLLCIKARAQPARAADAAARRARSCLFQRQVLLQRDSHLLEVIS